MTSWGYTNAFLAAAGLWVILELLFFAITILYMAPRMNPLETPPKYPIEGKQLILKIIAMAEWFSRFEEMGEGVSEFVSGWFLGTPISAIRRDNAIEFLAWAMYTSEVDALSADERKKLMETLAVIEEYLPHKFEPGRNPEARCIRHTLSPVVPFSHLPLAVYLGLGLLRVVARGILAVNGFRREVAPCGKFCYWYRGVKRGGERARPVVFLHGICSSILWYLEMIWKLSRGKACVVVELSPIAMHLSVFRACALPSEDEMVASIESIMSRHRIRRAAFVAHSFGSIAVAWVARRRPELVSQIGLMDPVSLLLFMPNVAKAFLHPETMEDSIIKRALLIISREKGVSYTLHRHFWWYTVRLMWNCGRECLGKGWRGRDVIASTFVSSGYVRRCWQWCASRGRCVNYRFIMEVFQTQGVCVEASKDEDGRQ